MSGISSEQAAGTQAENSSLSDHVVLCTGYIPPYQLPVYQEIAARVGRLSVLVSTPMEGNRNWQVDFGDLDVIVQRTWTVRKRWKQSQRFDESGELHVPTDTLAQLKRLDPDILVSEELGPRSLLAARFARRRGDLPLVLACNVSEHTEADRGWLRIRLRRWLAKRCSAVTVNGSSGRRYLESVGFGADKIHAFPYVANADAFLACDVDRPIPAEHHVVVCGELSQRKGVLLLLERLTAWASRNPERALKVTFIGEGPLRGELESAKLPDSVDLQLLGHIDYAAIAEVYNHASLLAFPTWADEWGLVVNEALAAGVPVLGSVYSQAVQEVIVEGVNGWRFRPDELAEFDSAIHSALGNSPEQLRSMRQSCRESICQRTPSWAAEQFVQALRYAKRYHADASRTH